MATRHGLRARSVQSQRAALLHALQVGADVVGVSLLRGFNAFARYVHRFEAGEQCPFDDEITCRHVQRDDARCARMGDAVLHFHRLQHQGLGIGRQHVTDRC